MAPLLANSIYLFYFVQNFEALQNIGTFTLCCTVLFCTTT